MAKTALCIGINDYPGTGNDLAGCVNDARDWADTLEGRGHKVTRMLDGEAKLAAMKQAMTKHVEAAKAGDLVVITYSGHGSWQPDDDGDEPDGRDEGLCPHDMMKRGLLLDDDLYEIFSATVPGARVVFISDSCHSGTVARMARWDAADDVEEPAGGVIRFMPPGTFLTEAQARRARQVEEAPARGTSRGSALLLSGCTDRQYSYDAVFQGRPNGAMTFVALKTLAKLRPDATYVDWHRRIRARLPSAHHPQSPQLKGTKRQRSWKALQPKTG